MKLRLKCEVAEMSRSCKINNSKAPRDFHFSIFHFQTRAMSTIFYDYIHPCIRSILERSPQVMRNDEYDVLQISAVNFDPIYIQVFKLKLDIILYNSNFLFYNTPMAGNSQRITVWKFISPRFRLRLTRVPLNYINKQLQLNSLCRRTSVALWSLKCVQYIFAYENFNCDPLLLCSDTNNASVIARFAKVESFALTNVSNFIAKGHLAGRNKSRFVYLWEMIIFLFSGFFDMWFDREVCLK